MSEAKEKFNLALKIEIGDPGIVIFFKYMDNNGIEKNLFMLKL